MPGRIHDGAAANLRDPDLVTKVTRWKSRITEVISVLSTEVHNSGRNRTGFPRRPHGYSPEEVWLRQSPRLQEYPWDSSAKLTPAGTTSLFAGVFAAGAGFQREAEEGTFGALLLSPVSPTAVFLGKLVSNLTALVVIEFALLIAATILFHEPLLTPELVAIVMLGTAGYASLTTLLGALGSGPRTRAVLLPVMALPLLVPVLIAAVRGTGETLGLFGGDRLLGLRAAVDRHEEA